VLAVACIRQVLAVTGLVAVLVYDWVWLDFQRPGFRRPSRGEGPTRGSAPHPADRRNDPVQVDLFRSSQLTSGSKPQCERREQDPRTLHSGLPCPAPHQNCLT
jgi:hypothetical protein